MQPLKGHVENGQIVLDEPAELPEGTVLYVVPEEGHDGLTPEERFANHKAGIKAAGVVKRFGVRLVPRLYAHLNPMPYEKAVRMEAALADSLRKRGFQVFGGH